MITYAKARALLSPGDMVFAVASGKVLEAKVIKVLPDVILTDIDELFFDEHGYTWFLTKKVAKEFVDENRYFEG